MKERDQIQMMTRCRYKISWFQKQVRDLQDKAHAYETMAIHARLLQPRSGYGELEEDLVWKLDNEISKLSESMADKPRTSDATGNGTTGVEEPS